MSILRLGTVTAVVAASSKIRRSAPLALIYTHLNIYIYTLIPKPKLPKAKSPPFRYFMISAIRRSSSLFHSIESPLSILPVLSSLPDSLLLDPRLRVPVYRFVSLPKAHCYPLRQVAGCPVAGWFSKLLMSMFRSS